MSDHTENSSSGESHDCCSPEMHEQEVRRSKVLREVLPLIFAEDETFILVWGDPAHAGLFGSTRDETELIHLIGAALTKIHAMSDNPDALPMGFIPLSPKPYLN